MKTIILLFLLFTCNSFAQNLKVGFQLESVLYYTNSELIDLSNYTSLSNKSYRHYNPFPSSFYIKFGSDITKRFSAELKSGFIIADDYIGFETGIFSSYKLYKSLRLIAFYNHHSNSNGGSNTGGSLLNDFGLIGLGGGINLSDVTTIEFLYSKPIVESSIGGQLSFGEGILWSKSSLISVFKVGIGFSWSIVDF